MNRLRHRALLPLFGLFLALFFGSSNLPHAAQEQQSTPKFEIQPGDRIAILGNTLADRMQHDGWVETFIQSRFPKDKLVFRNLGFSADELTIRLRSAAFGSPDTWLTHAKADVVFAFFGYNESFQGKPGLDKFKKDLDDFVKKTLAQKYNGTSAPRLVLFSPIAHENLKDRNLPDGKENNERIEMYTGAMVDVAKANKVFFVDLFHPTLELYGKATEPLTINGVHLNEHGNKLLAEVIDAALFTRGVRSTSPRGVELEKVRQAVLDRNFYWFNRYRTVDGYSIYGGRADLRFTDGQTNRVVMQREMEILDEMTANRDKRVWAVAQGGDLKVDDSNLSPFIPVKTNKPGPLPGGKHLFYSGEESIKNLKIAPGFKVNLFASEKEFPELTNAVQMSWDTKGRLWVAVWPTYPHWKPGEPMNDKLLIFEDTKGTGKADKCTVFADGLHCPTGFEFWKDGVIVAQAPDLMFLKDSKGGDKADIRKRILSGIDSADTHHTSNSFVLDPGGALYFQEGTFHHTQVETPWGPPQRCANAGVFRYEPRAQKFEVYVAYGFANPHGHVFDRWGQDIVVDGTGAVPYHAALFSGYLPYPQRHAGPPHVYQQQSRPCPGMEILSSRHFPESMQGHLLVANVIGFQGIFRERIDDKGASFQGVHQEHILSSTDPKFRPSDLRIGPDGALYFLDWHNPIVGHMQHNLRDPSRDREHGRIYRVTYEGRPLLTPPKIYGEPIGKLLELLKSPEDRVRYRTRIELSGRDSDAVIAATNRNIVAMDGKVPEVDEHLMLEALWLHQSHNVVNENLLNRMLTSPDFRARAAATRVLCYWRDRVTDALELLKKQASDEHPRVRLEAVRAASFFKSAEAVEVVLISAEKPADPFIDFVRGETMKALQPYVQQAINEGRMIPFTSLAGARFFLKNVTTENLLKMKGSRPVYLELVFRKGLRDEQRQSALTSLAKLENKHELSVLIDAIKSQDQDTQDESVTYDLVRLLTTGRQKELPEVRGDLEKLAKSGNTPTTRQLGYVVLIAADGNVDKAWDLAVKSVSSLQDLVNAMPLIRDPGQRAALYPKILPLVKGLPKELGPASTGGKMVMGRFVRVELPGAKRTLTLAEVEVYSGGKNIARQGKASQISTSNGGDASKAIDGNTSGAFSSGGQTHTPENIANPWWEVDLGAEQSITSIVIFNRTDAALGKRLDPFTLKVLDQNRRVVFEKAKQPAPAVKVGFEVGREAPDLALRHAAMVALTSVRGQEETTFNELARLVIEQEKETKDNALRIGVGQTKLIQASSKLKIAGAQAQDAKILQVDEIRGAPHVVKIVGLKTGQSSVTITDEKQVSETRKVEVVDGDAGGKALQIELGQPMPVGVSSKLKIAKVDNLNGNIARVEEVPGNPFVVNIVGIQIGRAILIFTDEKNNVEVLEVKIVVAGAAEMRKADRHAAVKALQRIPARFWPKDEVRPLLDQLLLDVRAIPAKERTTPFALDALQLADALANTLPLKEAKAVRSELGELGVRMIRVGTIPDQMLFDKERIAVKAGKPVEIIFENTDIMPHNLVITSPGSLEEIGQLAETRGTQPDAAQRQYVPDSPKILFKSILLAPRGVQKIAFIAPTRPGIYPIVCTYPGHWRRMFAALYVVDDLEEYQADPEGYLAKNPLPIADELLKLNRPRKDWKYEELAPAVAKMTQGRNFANARQLFQVANCVACHKMNGVGTEIGPDLMKLDPKNSATDILKDILEPSFRINEKFQTFTFEMQDGKVITGLIVEETPQTVKVMEDPIAKKQPLLLKKADIAERRKSATSIMPKGQVDRLTHEEILDLVAYIIARGNPQHPVFQGAHEHGHKGH